MYIGGGVLTQIIILLLLIWAALAKLSPRRAAARGSAGTMAVL